MEIVTNNNWRDVVYGFDLPEKLRADFDYLDDIECAQFVKYRGQFYDLGDFVRLDKNSPFTGWHGYLGSTYFSGVLVKLSRDGDQVMVGRYFS